jgi:N6-adenosine-specific RNA methylase IME4
MPEEHMIFSDLPKNHFGAILADPPWKFETWGSQINSSTDVNRHYRTMSVTDIAEMNIKSLAIPDSVLFLWVTWPILDQAMDVIHDWGFRYKTCAFAWVKADASQFDMFRDDLTPRMGNGYWTRSNSEVCLLATRGTPKRFNTDVSQAIIEPRREHSRKPDCIHGRIEQLVAGPYLELFARKSRPGWTTWGNERTKFDSNKTWSEMWEKPFHRPELL